MNTTSPDATESFAADCIAPTQLLVAEPIAADCIAPTQPIAAEPVDAPPSILTAMKKPKFKRTWKRRSVFQKRGGMHLSDGDIRRLARRGGVKRMNAAVYTEARAALHGFLTSVIGTAVTYSGHARRTTVTFMDVVYALKKDMNMTLYM